MTEAPPTPAKNRTALSDPLAAFRPAGDSSAAVADALAKAGEAHADAMAKLEALEASRGEALLSGPAEAAGHEAALTTARDAAGQLSALVLALEARKAAALKAERLAAYSALVAEAEAMRESLNTEGREAFAEALAIIGKVSAEARQLDFLAWRIDVMRRELHDAGIREAVAPALGLAWALRSPDTGREKVSAWSCPSIEADRIFGVPELVQPDAAAASPKDEAAA